MKQWGALAMLALGVGLVQVSSSSSKSSSDSEDDGAGIDDAEGDEDGSGQNPLLGLVMVLLACCTSGFAGVYFEKVRIPLCSLLLIERNDRSFAFAPDLYLCHSLSRSLPSLSLSLSLFA